MSSKHKRTRDTDAITISSSSSSSQASEDGALESDEESSSRRGGFAGVEGMSERQTWKINSGSFGMFNHPALMPLLPHSSSPEKKRRRVKECSDYKRTPRSSKSSRSQYVEPEMLMVDDDQEDEQSLFVPDTTSQSQPISVNDDPESDGGSSYEGLTPERAFKVKKYIHVVDTVKTAESSLQTADDSLETAAEEHATLSQKLMAINTTAEHKIDDIMRERDETTRIANEQAEERIQRVRDGLHAKKESYEERMQDCARRQAAAEDGIAKMEAELMEAMEKKRKLEHQGGFELCSDVRDVQAKKMEKGK
ncbi:hypothetical protein EKO04_007609 [Ascochyta lentis]|uniref:Uncharacterized protein n=1 Tax=Ascochyta lentis TaxID=205686 RepID=A0A8H7IXP9_9PLEO|nr:hypothetical protein EKO04_007609 [Ascochyta lentis]